MTKVGKILIKPKYSRIFAYQHVSKLVISVVRKL